MAPRRRPRPRAKRQPAKSRLKPCVYAADRALPDPRVPDTYLCRCGLPQGHVRHQLPDAGEDQAQHRARAGDDT